ILQHFDGRCQPSAQSHLVIPLLSKSIPGSCSIASARKSESIFGKHDAKIQSLETRTLCVQVDARRSKARDRRTQAAERQIEQLCRHPRLQPTRCLYFQTFEVAVIFRCVIREELQADRREITRRGQ
ncbi:hypothetical protein, partial [Mesorhizobium sp.]|uniref:hypothetical protein n=1 Tax=Mesorhizobium sp. TaxID=1871066 RepID=UPI0025B90AD1